MPEFPQGRSGTSAFFIAPRKIVQRDMVNLNFHNGTIATKNYFTTRFQERHNNNALD